MDTAADEAGDELLKKDAMQEWDRISNMWLLRGCDKRPLEPNVEPEDADEFDNVDDVLGEPKRKRYRTASYKYGQELANTFVVMHKHVGKGLSHFVPLPNWKD